MQLLSFQFPFDENDCEGAISMTLKFSKLDLKGELLILSFVRKQLSSLADVILLSTG